MAKIIFEGKSYKSKSSETVLETLLRGGANVDFSCRKGTCQACMLDLRDGELDEGASHGLRPELVALGCFLPCQARPQSDVVVERPDPSALYVRAHLHEKSWLSATVCRLLFEPETVFDWKAGQFVNVRRSDGMIRSYSLASVPEEDYFIELHVKRVPGGEMSSWLCDETSVGDVLEIQGPVGRCVYEPDYADRNLLLLATGTGLAPLIGVARDALRQGHRGEIHLYHGSRTADGLYLNETLERLASTHDNFYFEELLTSVPVPEGVGSGLIVAKAFENHDELSDWAIYLCGVPDMVHEARYHAVLAGAARGRIHADPFEFAHPVEPRDREKIAGLEPSLDLWKALEEGPGLMRIIRDFYDIVFEDPLLSPFFHRVTKQRAIEKQYAFLADLFTGESEYFGLRPFNAHHWMVISDELFDYREDLFEECVRARGLPEQHIRRWMAIHELFRREIVKNSARGLIIDGVEHMREGYSEVTIDFATVCDGCMSEMPVGVTGRLHNRTGELFCESCGGATLEESSFAGVAH